MLLLIVSWQAQAQWATKSFTFGGINRQYRVYTPGMYNPSNPASLVIALHGLGDNMNNFSGIGFHYIADTANIIVMIPQAVSDPFAGTAWNSGAGYMGYYPNQSVNDIGFLNALIDTAKANFSIDRTRVYLCGFSMGGFMTERMALQSNGQIAAFVSMSGTIGSAITSYNPGRKIPIAHFHGTTDGTVAFSGNQYGLDADSLVSFWTLHNQCNMVPDSSTYPDLANDSITVDRFKFSNTQPNADVWFFRMNGADHTVLFRPTNDIMQPLEAWLFMRQFTNPTAGQAPSEINGKLGLYPNPASGSVNVIIPQSLVSLDLSIYNLQGQLMLSIPVSGGTTQVGLDPARFVPGIYMVRVSGNGILLTSRIVVQ